MRFTSKLIWIGIAVLVVVFAFQALILNYVMKNNYESIQKAESIEHNAEIVDQINKEFKNLESKTQDWAAWDDTYRFVQDPYDEYIKSNLNDETLENIGAQIIIISNGSKGIVFSKSLDPSGIGEIPVPEYFSGKEFLGSSLMFSDSDENNNSITGILSTPQGLKVISSAPILTSERKGPIRGTLLIGYDLDSRFIKKISFISNLTIEVIGLQELISSSNRYSELVTTGVYFQRNSDQTLSQYSLLNDVFGRGTIVIKITSGRQLYVQSQQSLFSFFMQMMLFIIVTSLLLYFILNAALQKRDRQIIEIKEFARSITVGDYGKKIVIHSKDELGELAELLNRMEEEIMASNEKLKRESKELEVLNKGLENKVSEKTKEIEAKLSKEEKATKAMIYILERAKRAKDDLEVNQKELANAFNKLQKAEMQIRNEKEMVEQKVIDRTKQLEIEKNKVSDLLKLKNEFINQLSHDLRTPLTPLKILIPIVKDHTIDPEMKKHLVVCLNNIEYLNNLVMKTLDLARLDAGKLQFEFKNVDMHNLARKILSEKKVVLDEAGIVVENKIKHRTIIKADELRISEIFNNLIDNAKKYMKGKGRLTISSQQTKTSCIISFKDTGIGMDKLTVSKLFNEFYKADSSRHDMQSFGLGLAITKRIVELHGGEVWVQSPGLGKGSTFFVKLPLKGPKNVPPQSDESAIKLSKQ